MMKHNLQTPIFIPTTAQEVDSLGWNHLDVILITGVTGHGRL